MLLTIAVILVVLWLFGFFLHVAGGLIHVVLVIAAIMLILHFVRGCAADQFRSESSTSPRHPRRETAEVCVFATNSFARFALLRPDRALAFVASGSRI